MRSRCGSASTTSCSPDALERVERLRTTTPRLVLGGAPDLGERVRDLTDRETACCPYFTLTIDEPPVPDADHSKVADVDVTVPAVQSDVLDTIAERARTVDDVVGSRR